VNEPDDRAVAGAFARARASRRAFLAACGAAAAACGSREARSARWEAFVQQHYKRLTEADKERIFARLEAEVRRRHGVAVRVRDPAPLRGVEFGYALNLSACVGCRRCEEACAVENNTSRDPSVRYLKVLQMNAGSLDVERARVGYQGPVPAEGHFYMPVQCQQCRDAPCVRVCPVGATWTEPDGITVVDYNWCIGCRYCEAACPYFARRFNFAEPDLRPSELNPDQGYLSNRLRPVGVVEKCTFCLHRVRRGEYPACLEACPTGARKFGNLLDPASEVRQVIDHKRVYVLREDVGTGPRFYYFFD
jgi:molybdopterin-containing oxidoreductase family iron-sulfur binding subunit